MRRCGRTKRGEVLESTGKAEGFIMLARGLLAVAVNVAQIIRVKAPHRQA